MSDRKSVLRVVAPGETPPAAKKLTLSEAIETGSYVDILTAQRAEIVQSLPNEKGPAKAALHRQLSLISKEIEALNSREDDEEAGGVHVEDGEFDAAAI